MHAYFPWAYLCIVKANHLNYHTQPVQLVAEAEMEEVEEEVEEFLDEVRVELFGGIPSQKAATTSAGDHQDRVNAALAEIIAWGKEEDLSKVT